MAFEDKYDGPRLRRVDIAWYSEVAESPLATLATCNSEAFQ